MRANDVIEIVWPTKVGAPLSLCLFLPIISSLAFSPLPGLCLALPPMLVSRMNFLPFVSLSFLECEGKFGMPCWHGPIPLHRATGSSHYHCPYAQTQHLSPARKTRETRCQQLRAEPALLLTSSLCELPGQGEEEEEEGRMAHAASRED